jgi:prepilin-type N-terminal cleavage/methylation domain-containing protein
MNSHPHQKGFTLIETLVGSLVFAVIVLACYQAFGVLTDAVLESRAKVAATEVANAEFEIMRNLPYVNVGVAGGIPVGTIPRTQTIIQDNYSFNVNTSIRSVDDPFDGTVSSTPADTSPADYKMAELDITCTNCRSFSPLEFNTLVAPHALETGSTNGALFMQVLDSGGLAVAGASLHIVNTQTNPDTIIDETTDNSGYFKIVDAPPGTNAYNITATKSGYSTDQTYPPGGAAGATPVKPDSTVVAQQVTQVSFAIDKVSTLNVSTVNASCVALPSIGFSLTGTKLIGSGVLKYPTTSFTTNASGTYALSNMEWDTYGAALTSVSYDLAGTTPLPSFSLAPNTTSTLQLVAVPHVTRALLVTVKDASTGLAINGATVQLTKSGFNQTQTTGSGTCVTPGQVFWNGLASGTYTLTVSKAGHTTYTNNALNVSAAWQNQTISF